MAIYYDAPTTGNPGGPDFETKIQTGYTQTFYPLQSVNNFTAMIFGRKYVQQLEDWTPGTLNTEDSFHSGFYLYEETKPETITPGGLVSWEQFFGTVPTAFNTYSYQAVTFPGYYSAWDADSPVSPATSVYRPPLTKIVRVRETHTFALTNDPSSTFDPIDNMKLQTGEKAYVDYVDGETITNEGGYPPDSSTMSLTYSEYQNKVNGTASISEITVKEPVVQRAYGAGNIWEMIQYLAVAE